MIEPAIVDKPSSTGVGVQATFLHGLLPDAMGETGNLAVPRFRRHVS
jgi:hypothetical protein